MRVKRTCSVEEDGKLCGRPCSESGFCHKHYIRWWRHGDPLALLRTPNGEPMAFFEAAMLLETDGCIEWPYVLSRGYGQVNIFGVMKSVHVLACERAHGSCPSGMEAAHGPCHNPKCFNPRHLSWKTKSENAFDKVRDGTAQRGSSHGMAKLTEAEVKEIRQQYATGEWTHWQLAKEFGVSRSAISLIIKRRKWAHV